VSHGHFLAARKTCKEFDGKIMAAKVDENRRSGKNIRYLIFVG